MGVGWSRWWFLLFHLFTSPGGFLGKFCEIRGGGNSSFGCRPPLVLVVQLWAALDLAGQRRLSQGRMHLQASCCNAMAFTVQPSFNAIFPVRCVSTLSMYLNVPVNLSPVFNCGNSLAVSI